jgi:hypothetical protein
MNNTRENGGLVKMSKLKCKKCGDIIESKHRHDLRWCSCHSCYVDGGNDYFRIGYYDRNDIEIIDEEESENGFQSKCEEIRR